MRTKLTVGNWKMNGGLADNAARLGGLAGGWKAPAGREIAVCAPFPYLAQVQSALAGSAVAWGAQDVSAHASGAYTGEVSAGMLAEFGCRYAIVGHSERRQLHGERDGTVAAKAKAAVSLRCGFPPSISSRGSAPTEPGGGAGHRHRLSKSPHRLTAFPRPRAGRSLWNLHADDLTACAALMTAGPS